MRNGSLSCANHAAILNAELREKERIMQINLGVSGHMLTLELGLSVDQLRAAIGPLAHEESTEPETATTYFLLKQYGIEIVARDGLFRCVFLYLSPQQSGGAAFMGTVDLLPAEFVAAPSEKGFQAALYALGFTRSARRFPNAVDMLTDQVRLRYEKSEHQHIVLFDDGALAR